MLSATPARRASLTPPRSSPHLQQGRREAEVVDSDLVRPERSLRTTGTTLSIRHHLLVRQLRKGGRHPGDCCVHHGQRVMAMHVRHIGYAKHAAEPLGLHLKRPVAGAVPGAGCGNAVDIAVWKATFPSTFCMI